jgi:hypothetical protein
MGAGIHNLCLLVSRVLSQSLTLINLADHGSLQVFDVRRSELNL